jgi:hypothetical protein
MARTAGSQGDCKLACAGALSIAIRKRVVARASESIDPERFSGFRWQGGVRAGWAFGVRQSNARLTTSTAVLQIVD